MGRSHAGAVHEELQPMRRTPIGKVHGGLSVDYYGKDPIGREEEHEESCLCGRCNREMP